MSAMVSRDLVFVCLVLFVVRFQTSNVNVRYFIENVIHCDVVYNNKLQFSARHIRLYHANAVYTLMSGWNSALPASFELEQAVNRTVVVGGNCAFHFS